MAPDTAFAYLTAREGRREEAARSCYEGSDYRGGERDKSAVLQRTYPEFASLWAEGEFADWARQLYQPLLDANTDKLITITRAGEEQA